MWDVAWKKQKCHCSGTNSVVFFFPRLVPGSAVMFWPLQAVCAPFGVIETVSEKAALGLHVGCWCSLVASEIRVNSVTSHDLDEPALYTPPKVNVKAQLPCSVVKMYTFTHISILKALEGTKITVCIDQLPVGVTETGRNSTTYTRERHFNQWSWVTTQNTWDWCLLLLLWGTNAMHVAWINHPSAPTSRPIFTPLGVILIREKCF